MLRKIMLGVCAVGLPLGLLAVVVAPSVASASVTKNGTGTYSCTKITGTLTYNPPISNASTATKETLTVKIKASGCSGGSPAVAALSASMTHVSKGSGVGTCGSALGGGSADLKVAYTNGAAASTITGTITPGSTMSGKADFTVNPAKVTGSYPTTTADVAADLSQTETQILAACGKKTGVKTLKITAGTATGV
jgi:hypothetical protein